MTNHEGLYAFSRPKSFDAILRAPFDRAIISALLFFSAAVAPSLLSQSLSKEYFRLGGRVVAVESFSFSVTPDPPTSVLGADNQQTFTASRTANWSVTSGGTIAPGAGLSTTLSVANPIPNGLLSLTVTATEQGGSGSKSIIVPLMTPVSISGAVTTLNPVAKRSIPPSPPSPHLRHCASPCVDDRTEPWTSPPTKLAAAPSGKSRRWRSRR